MSGVPPEIRTARSAIQRLQRSLDREKEAAERIKAEPFPDNEADLLALHRRTRDAVAVSRDYLKRYEDNIADLERELIQFKDATLVEEIDDVMDPLHEYVLSTIRWIREYENFSKDAENILESLKRVNQPANPNNPQPPVGTPSPSADRPGTTNDMTPATPSDQTPAVQGSFGGLTVDPTTTVAATPTVVQTPAVQTPKPQNQLIQPPVFQMPPVIPPANQTASAHASNGQGPSNDALQNQIARLLLLYENQQGRNAGMQSTTNTASVKAGVARLPKLELQKFSGEPEEWRGFWDSFRSSVHDVPEMKPVEKMKYLRSLLTDQALKTIGGLSVCDDSYEAAIALLVNTYGKPETQIAAIHAKLMQLKHVPNETKRLRNFYLDLESALRSLEALDQHTENPHFVSLILSKLPQTLIIDLERAKGPMKAWTVTTLRDLLNHEITLREATERYKRTGTFEPEKPSSKEQKDPPKPPSIADALVNPVTPKQNPPNRPPTHYSPQHPPQSKDPPKKIRVFCRNDHWSDECPQYLTVSERKERIKGRCYICLGNKHMARDCVSTKPCYYCKDVKRHHSSLCPQKFGHQQPKAKDNPSDDSRKPPDSGSSKDENGTTLLLDGESVLLQMAKCRVKSSDSSDEVGANLILDSASTRSFITKKLAAELGLKQETGVTLKVGRFGSDKSLSIQTTTAKLQIVLLDGTTMDITVNVVPTITKSLERIPVPADLLDKIPRNVILADGNWGDASSGTVDLLIGNDYYLDITTGERVNVDDGLYLMGTHIGWILTGRIGQQNDNGESEHTLLIQAQAFPRPHDLIQKYPETESLKAAWEDMCKLETIGINENPEIKDDDLAVQQFENSVSFEKGRYAVSWPYRNNIAELPTNFGLAMGRFRNLLRRLRDRPELFQKYQKILKDQLENGIIETCEPPKGSSRVHYIAHHPVETPQKNTTKVRIVYDASAKSHKTLPSLNDCLLRGPLILQDLIVLLIRFRAHEIGITADIEKAFLQVGLHESDRDLTRFIWLKKPDDLHENNAQEFRFARVPFGMTSSPFLLNATVKHHLSSQKTKTATAEKIRDNLYVDNVVTGVSTEAEALEFYKEAKEIFQEASMNLREWLTSDSNVNYEIPATDQAGKTNAKVLGIKWNVDKDTLGFQAPGSIKSAQVTKREVLCFQASVYDPMGILLPITMKSKIFFLSLWEKKFDWDDELTDDELKEWLEIASEAVKSRKIGNHPLHW